jgi:hypothetical protein
MAYSSIKKKYGKCIDCSPNEPEQYVIAKRCPNHYKIYRAKIQLEKQKTRNKVRSLHILPNNRSMVEDKSALREWFKYHAANSERKCENCGADLSSYSDADWRACQHHLIDKSPTNGCPSVAAVLENHGVLCKWGKGDSGGCHSLWHSSYETASKMPFFKIAKERFEKFKHLISEEEKRKIPRVFN